jgi:hypothetical protein
MSESRVLVFTLHTSVLVEFTKICHLVFSTISTNGRLSSVTVSTKLRSF